MNFDPTPEQRLLRDTVRSFVAAECPREVVRALEGEGRFPRELWVKLAGLGLLDIAAPHENDGEAVGAIEQAIVVEELARGSVALAVAFVNTACLAAPVLAGLGSASVQSLIAELVAGRLIASFAWTEPSAGSDILAMRTTARRVPDGSYVLNGSKTFITLAAEADQIFTIARTDRDPTNRAAGLSCFLLAKGSDGLSVRRLAKVGQKSAPFAELFFSDVVVPAERLIGEEGSVWWKLTPYLRAERILFAALCLGIAREAFQDAVEHSLAREAFGRSIAHFQAIQHHIADMKTSIDAAELLVYRAAWLAAAGRDSVTEGTQALMVAAAAAGDVADRGMQIMGGAAYTTELDMERYWRDARAFRLSPVTAEVAKNLIAQAAGLPRSY